MEATAQLETQRPLTAADVRTWCASATRPAVGADLPDDVPDPVVDAELIDLVGELERLSAACSAAQARLTVQVRRRRTAQDLAAGVPAARAGHAVAAEVALARRCSPHTARRLVGLAGALVEEMPHTLAALERGDTTEWRATLIARETACLEVEHRRQVDQELAERPGGLAALGDRASACAAREVAYRLDPHAATKRAALAEAERCVWSRPAPDTMCRITAVLPVRQGVAVIKALRGAADSAGAAGDERTRGQVMADTLVERVTGLADAGHVPLEVQVVVSDAALMADDPTPAVVPGHGPVPAPLVREWLREAHDVPAVWLRRLYARPEDGVLVAREQRRRRFTGQLRAFVVGVDQVCRTPWCDAPVRHADHAKSTSLDSATCFENAQGLCAACNYAKEAPGWSVRAGPDGVVVTTTPSGHVVASATTAAPRPAGRGLPAGPADTRPTPQPS